MITPMVAFVGTSGRAAGLCGTPRAARLADHHRLDAVLARLQERAGQIDIAVQHYTRAAARARNTAERDYLTKQAARLRRK